MIFLQNNNLIEEKAAEYEDFVKYCKESGKQFVYELDREDFIAYRAEYSVPRERVEQLKFLLGFRERKSAEKISAPQAVSHKCAAPKNSLGRRFGVVDLSTYEDVLIAEMDFNNRVKNRLNANGCRTLAELLKSSQQEIADLKNFGKRSLDNLIATLKDFFNSRERTCSSKALRLANEELDKFLRDAALNHNPQIDLIITAFEEFAASVTKKTLLRNLPDDLMLAECSDKAALDESDWIKGLPDIIEENLFDELIADWALERNCSFELLKIKLSAIYRHSGKIFHRGKLTLNSECGYLLKERFPNGYKIGDELFHARFMRYLQEIFDEKISLTQHKVDAKIATIGVLCDRGKYIHPDFVHISSDIMERVKNFIDASARTAISFKEIFEALKDFFVGTQITNHYFLQGAIKLHNLPYTLRKDYLTKASAVDMVKEFDSFVAERGEVSLQEIKDNFISMEDFNITFLVGRCPDVIRGGDGTLIHATRLNLNEEDFTPVRNFLRRNCSTPVNSRVLFDLFCEHFAAFMNRNDIQNHNKLFGVLQYMFRDEFNFSRPYISAADIKDINNKKFLLSLLSGRDEIEFGALTGICEENGIHYVARSYFVDSLRPEFIRVDKLRLRRPESIGVTDKVVSAVAENVRAAVERNGGWQAAQTFDDYEWLPQLKTPWNSFLLESVVALADNAPYRLKIPSISLNFSSTVFLAEKFGEDDFQSFLTKILIAEHKKEPFRSDKEIFNWLKGQGLCHKKFPKFLEGGRAFKLLGE